MVLELFGGLIYLLLAGDLLVRGAIALAKKARIPPMIVGLTIVAFGTSAPELCISIGATFQGHSGLAIGNVVGSNIANVLLVLGLPALIYPTLCDQESIGRDTGLMIAASVLFVGFCFLGPLGRIQGGVMFVLLVLLLYLSAREARRERGRAALAAESPELERVLGVPSQKRMISLFLLLGCLGLPVGAELMVEGAVRISQSLGVSDAAIGLSVVALGTSLPELGTTVVAALHRQSDVALGNVIGSNLFNILAIMGITSLVAPGPIPVPPSLLSFDLIVMLCAALVLAYFAWSGSIGRRWGLVLLAGYGLYIAALFELPALTGTAAGVGS